MFMFGSAARWLALWFCWPITALHILIIYKDELHLHIVLLLNIWIGVLSCRDTGDADASCLACAATILPSPASCMLPLASLFLTGRKKEKQPN
jgi:uncharacterized membrane protein YedE/YeeE